MLLTLRILSYRNQPVPPAPAVRFTAAGGSIGRSADNALVLDDPSKYISRVHARVLCRGDTFLLEDLGSNASVLNDRPLGKGSQAALGHGDRLAIGDYQLQVLIEASPAAAPLAPAPVNDAALPLFEPPPPPVPVQLPPLDFAPAPAATPAPAAVFADPLAGASILDVLPGQGGGLAGDDPLGLNLFGSAPQAPARAAESDHVSPELAAFPQHAAAPAPFAPAPSAPSAQAGGFAIPHDYDPLADFFAPPAVAPVPPTPAPAPAAVPAALHAPLPDAVPDAVLGGANADMTALIAQPLQPAPLAPPAPVPAAPPSATTAPALAGQGSAPASDAVLQALLRGLGLPGLQLQRPATEVAELVGALLREATAGTMDVLMARAMTKKESRIDMTMLSVRANNPLKFFPNADGALTQMLTGTMAGYMAPRDAMAGAFDDLRAHELAVIAGMRAALGAVLHRFDPARIEERLDNLSVMDKMLSSNRKARMWDRLVELYAEIAREADDDLQRLFGEKFSEAYEEQVARLRQAKQ
ncbi:type VI secretion system-associated FHA domain protein TagH [Herbaspirillum sp. SJZ107]|uniref:type VI secretion system-associated FHA domain protein TagH n=1 Tax=Herbaspirillum sp. SJZ107 TaxID=2572881 RepID=UPI00114FB129|nr:type VI secretion system-associated FHA domain protein TagH [Herbaspirillum sp. SJZ107]TQK08267.1 FHA domain protein [Herbaspirillum sp. SJZ107]